MSSLTGSSPTCLFLACSPVSDWTTVDHDQHPNTPPRSRNGCEPCRAAALSCVRNGCTNAWRPLHQILDSAIQATLARFLTGGRNHEGYHDIQQEATLKLYRYLAEGHGSAKEGHLRDLARKTARNAAIDHFRRHGGLTKRPTNREERIQFIDVDDAYTDAIDRERQSRETDNTLFERVDELELIERCLVQSVLTDAEREAFTLSVFQGWTQVDIAKKLGVNQSTVARLIAKAKEKIRATLMKLLEDGGDEMGVSA